MKRLIASLLGVILILTACGQAATNKHKMVDNQTFKLGVILPLTGGAGIYGQNSKKGIELGVEEINQSSGILSQQIELIIEDTKGEVDEGVSALNKVINLDKPSVVIGAGISTVTLGMVPIAEANKVVLFSTLSSAPSLSQAGDYFFRNYQSDDLEAKVMAEFAAQDLGYKTVNTLCINNDYGLELVKSFKNNFEKFGGRVKVSEKFSDDEVNFRTHLKKLGVDQPEAIYVLSYPRETPLILKQMDELGLDIQILGSSALIDEKNKVAIQQVGLLAEGIIYTNPASVDKDNQIAKAFQDNYQKKHGEEIGLSSDLGYDAVYLIKKAIELTGCMTSECIKNGLYRIRDFPGAAGPTTFGENGDVEREIIIKTIKDGQFVEYD